MHVESTVSYILIAPSLFTTMFCRVSHCSSSFCILRNFELLWNISDLSKFPLICLLVRDHRINFVKLRCDIGQVNTHEYEFKGTRPYSHNYLYQQLTDVVKLRSFTSWLFIMYRGSESSHFVGTTAVLFVYTRRSNEHGSFKRGKKVTWLHHNDGEMKMISKGMDIEGDNCDSAV
jgi:hypothetical protein